MSSTSPSPISGVPPPTSAVSPPPQPSPPPPTSPTAPPPQDNSPPPPPQSPAPPISPPPPSQSQPPQLNSPPPPPPQSPAPTTPSPPPQSPPTAVSPPPSTSPPPPTALSSPPPRQIPPPPPNPPPPTTSPPPPPPRRKKTPPPPRPPRRPPPPPPATPPHKIPPSSSSSSPPPPPPPTNSTPPTPPFHSPPSLQTSPPFHSPPSLQTSPPSFSPSPPFQTTASPSPPSHKSLSAGIAVAVAIIASLILLGIFGIAALCLKKKRKKKDSTTQNGDITISASIQHSTVKDSGSVLLAQISPSNIRNESMSKGNSRSWFSYQELIEATDGFSDKNLLGEGGFGYVYIGNLSNGKEVAVKRLKIGGKQGEREFRSEVEIISRIHHRHLVSLVGYCISEDRRLLVYEYVPNNTLYYHLHGRNRPIVDWPTRVKIAIGVARGIAYLHEDCHPRIIHRDIKSSNILLDDKFEARVSDFGLAKIAMDANSHITTRVMGTFGYMAPEYATSGKLTEKSDIFSFGVVLLELITGRKPVDTSQPLGEESLVEWVRPLLSHAIETEEFSELADQRLEGNYIDGEMFRMIEAAAACVRHSSAKRPKMGQIVRAFEGILDLNNGMKVGESGIFNSAQQSEEIRLFQRMAFGSRNYSTDFFSRNSGSSS